MKTKGLVQQRLDFLSKVHHRVAKFIEDEEQKDDLIRWVNKPEVRELRPDTIPEQSERYGLAVWKLINSCMP
jgi:hypothetical protein